MTCISQITLKTFLVILALSAIFLNALPVLSKTGRGLTIKREALEQKAGQKKQFTITWESNEGIIKYHVEIYSEKGKKVFDRVVDYTSIRFVLPPGKYRVRIGGINVFEKISFWSPWKMIEVKKKRKKKFFTAKFWCGTGLKVSGGISYNYILPPFNSLYKNTCQSYLFMAGYYFGYSKKHAPKSALRFFGIELEGGYSLYQGVPSHTRSTSMKQTTGGADLSVRTRLSFPVNFALRAGAGGVYTIQNMSLKTFEGAVYQKNSRHSIDPYFKAGCSIEFDFLYLMSLDIGADYMYILYEGSGFSSLRFFALVGFRL